MDKICKNCKKKKPIKEFRKVGFYFKSNCSKCENKLNKSYYRKKAKKIKNTKWF